jgi:hypothetical protein
MAVILAPIVEGKLQAWKDWAGELSGPEFEDFNSRHGLTRHDAWLAETPAGPMVIVLIEGPGVDDFMPSLAASDNEYDRRHRDKIKEVHGMDVSQPPPGPLPEL